MDAYVSSQSAFLNLPTELRQHIYNYAIPTARLAPFPYLDPEWSMKPPDSEHRGTIGLLRTCQQIHNETAPIFYNRAILEVAPAQQSYTFADLQIMDHYMPYSYTRVVQTFRFYRPEHLRLIRKVHIYSNQADVVEGSCYEALLQWLVEHTAVENIVLSTRPMTRIRGRAGFDLPRWRAAFYDQPKDYLKTIRMIRIWTKSKRRPWEYEKMMRLKCKATDRTLHPLQLYFWSVPRPEADGKGKWHPGGHGGLQLDPRWLTRLNDEPENLEALETAAPEIDRLMRSLLSGEELKDYEDHSWHYNAGAWVYQMVLVA